MAKNIIFYGAPGTGKTYHMQKQIEKYTDYIIEDKYIKSAYILESNDWLLISLIILQNNNPMSSSDIAAKVSKLDLKYDGTISDVLEEHNIYDSKKGLARRQPRIFFLENGKWFVDRLRLLSYKSNFFKEYMEDGIVERRYDFVTFHQSFTYEDFVEGIRPSVDDKTKMLEYNPKPGVFKRICEKAMNNSAKQYALFIDEINRGNISEIFGELISLIELDKREGQYCELEAILPYSKMAFKVPNNLDIIGTMNSADKSIATIDMALRRRFDFEMFTCDYVALEKAIALKGIDAHSIGSVDVIKLLKVINKRIELLLGTDYIIGHAYFMKVETGDEIIAVVLKKILPLLEEYFFDDLQKVQMVFNDIDENGALHKDAIYRHTELEPDKLLTFVGDYTIESKKVYSISENVSIRGIIKVYEGVSI